MEQVDRQQPAGAEMRGNALEALLLVAALGQIREALDGDDRQIEARIELELSHIGFDELNAPRRVGLVIELGARDCEHVRRGVDADDRETSPRQRQHESAAATRDFEDVGALRPRQLHIQRHVGVELEHVIQARKLRIRPWVLGSNQRAARDQAITN